MHRRVREWLESLAGAWTPLPEAPDVLVPSEKCLGGELPIEEEEREGEEPCDDDPFVDYPWGLKSEQLLYLDWDRTVGMAGGTSYELVKVAGLGSFLFEIGFDGYVPLGALRKGVKGAGRLCLDLLLRTNGGAFHTSVIGSVPAEFGVGVAVGGDWLVDRLLCAFDEADAWESLLEECPWVWNEEYETPRAPDYYGSRFDELSAAYDKTRPATLGWPSGMGWERGREPWIRARLGIDAPFEPIHEIPPRGDDDKYSPRNKWRMLARWLSGPPEVAKADDDEDFDEIDEEDDDE